MAGLGGVRDRLYGTIYGQCIGDAIGLLTEFMTKTDAAQVYPRPLEYHMKVRDGHRDNWAVGDWTDDSDKMILIMQTLANSGGKVDKTTTCDFAKRLHRWAVEGFPELGDKGGCGVGETTQKVLKNPKFTQNPHFVALQVWQKSGGTDAPNGAVMRTSILGVNNYRDLPTVVDNTRAFCLTTHADPRCVASCVAVTTAIALMLQGWRDVPKIVQESFQQAQAQLPVGRDAMRQELLTYMHVRDLRTLELDERDRIGYTYKALGAGFWALRQRSFRDTIIQIAMEGGDAATNGAVAGALLGCRLAMDALRGPWLYGLRHKHWLDDQIQAYLRSVSLLQQSREPGRAKRHTSPKRPEVDQWLTDIIDRERERRHQNGDTDGEPHRIAAKTPGERDSDITVSATSSGRPQMVIGEAPEDQTDRDILYRERASRERVATTEGHDGSTSSDRHTRPAPRQQYDVRRSSPLGNDRSDRGTTPSADWNYRGRKRHTNDRTTGPRLGPLTEYVGRTVQPGTSYNHGIETAGRTGYLQERTDSDVSYQRPLARTQLTGRFASPQDRRDANHQYRRSNSPRQNFDYHGAVRMEPRRGSSPRYTRQSSPSFGPRDNDINSYTTRNVRHSLPADLKLLVEQSEVGVHKLNTTRMEELGSDLQRRCSSLPSGQEYTVDRTPQSSLGRFPQFEPSYLEQRAARRRARSDDVLARQSRTFPYPRSVSPARHVRFSNDY